MGGKQLKYIQTNYRWATVTTVIDQLGKTQDQKQTCDSSLIALIKGYLETKRSFPLQNNSAMTSTWLIWH